MNKRGWNEMWGVIIFIVVILIFAGITIYAGTKTSGTTFSSITAVQIKGSRDACKSEMDKIPKPTDADNDGFPDSMKKMGIACDLCLSSTPGRGDDSIDSDGDGIPADCDSDDEIPMDKKSSPEKECLAKGGSWDNNIGRCRIS
jgi:hypothetical protein